MNNFVQKNRRWSRLDIWAISHPKTAKFLTFCLFCLFAIVFFGAVDRGLDKEFGEKTIHEKSFNVNQGGGK
jgi:hypothetical protein